MKMNHSAMQNRPDSRAGRVLRIAGAKTVHIKRHLDFVKAVIDAVEKTGTPAAQHDLPVGPADCVLSTLEQHTHVGLHGKADAPSLVRCLDTHSVARTIIKSR